jgi:hypothetical protein
MDLLKFNHKVCPFARHPVSDNEIRIVTFAVAIAITVVSEWFLWIFHDVYVIGSFGD